MDNPLMSCTFLETSFGSIGVYASSKGVTRVVLGVTGDARASSSTILGEAADQLNAYFSGSKTRLRAPLDIGVATPFRIKVWDELARIEYGRPISYGQLAKKCGKPGAARAVGGAVGANPVPILIPCHRVISSDGSLGGFASGPGWKRCLLCLEGAL
jgi:methylated-DNA-[protein]-cysteine S-methyltransferase